MRFIKRFLAFCGVAKYVCEMSKHDDPYDYHDYLDSVEGEPWHFVLLTCKRCGKKFYI